MASKGKMIYTPSHWELLIQAAVNKSQCNVIMLCYDEIIDCKSLNVFPTIIHKIFETNFSFYVK